MKLITLILIFAAAALQAQLKEFTITPMESPTQFPPIMRSYPEDGALIVFSSVSGLQFESNNNTIDDIREESSKYTLFLKPETQIITVKKNGYREAKIMLQNVKSREVRYYSIEDKLKMLEQIPINIITQPAGSRIFLDGAFVGADPQQKVTPGVHKLRLEKEGCRAVDTSIEVSEKKTLFTYTLPKIEPVSISVASDPSGGQIYLNNEDKGITSKSFFMFPGTYRLRISKSGYLDAETDITVKETGENKFRYTLTKNAGILDIAVEPANSELYINKEKREAGKIELAPGKYKIEVQKTDYYPEEEVIEIVLGATQRRAYKLKAKTGALQVSVSPEEAGCTLTREGITVQEWKGAKLVKPLQTGVYEFKVSAPGYVSRNERVEIQENQTTAKDITLQQTNNTTAATAELETPEVTARKQRPDLFVPKDEFESSNKYQARAAEGAALIEKLKKEYDIKQQEQREAKIKASERVRIDLRVEAVGKYDADKEVFSVTIDGMEGEVYVPASEARFFKENMASLQVEAKERYDERKEKNILSSIIIRDLNNNKQYAFDDHPGFILVKGGWFNMGSNIGEDDEKPVHRVWVDDFYIGKYEVTQRQWQIIMGKNPSLFEGANLPVENVSWDDVQVYIKKLNKQTGKKYRLPTETEWEYAARGGILCKGYGYSGSNDLQEVAWHEGNASSKTHEIGTKQPNELGIYDMSGNVWEWCSDWYERDYYAKSPERNPKGQAIGATRVLRGGAWNLILSNLCRSTDRYSDKPDYKGNYIGFRVVQD